MAPNKQKRVRAPDFSEEEISVIRNNFVRYSKTLSAKHTNETLQKTKDEIYKNITVEVNAVGVAERSLQSIKDKWQTLKKNVKDKVNRSLREKRRLREVTGGGENPVLDEPDVLDGLMEEEKEILQVIPPEQIIGMSGGFATDEVVIDEETSVVDNPHVYPSTSESCPPNLPRNEKRKNLDTGPKSAPVNSNIKRNKGKITAVSSSEYYNEMIRIETEKLRVMKETLELQKWYMEQKIALLRQEKNTSSGEESQFFTLQPMAHRYEWVPSSHDRTASDFVPHPHAGNNNNL